MYSKKQYILILLETFLRFKFVFQQIQEKLMAHK